MYGIFVTLEIIIAILLVIAVLMQSSKGGGLAGSLGGGSMGAVFGVRRTADFLGKATTYLAFAYIAVALLINIAFLPTRQTTGESIIQRGNPTTVPAPVVPRSQPAVIPPEEQKNK